MEKSIFGISGESDFYVGKYITMSLFQGHTLNLYFCHSVASNDSDNPDNFPYTINDMCCKYLTLKTS